MQIVAIILRFRNISEGDRNDLGIGKVIDGLRHSKEESSYTLHPDYQAGRFCAEEALDNFSSLYRPYLANDCMLKAFCAYEKIAIGDSRIDLSGEVRANIVRVLSSRYPDPLFDEIRNKKSRQEGSSAL